MIGTTLSHYRIDAMLGRGGMGFVYRAWDTRLEREVALKLVDTVSVGEAKERLYREARAAARLNHPNIATIYEIDEAAGRLFIAMEYVEGETVDAALDPFPVLPERVIEVAGAIADALAAAHAKGIVHRDIKPGNIMLRSDGVLKILDFGLARRLDQAPITREGTTVGTIHYMSPEQARGERVDARSDLWSLGVMMYEMLTGSLPFGGGYEAAVLYQILNDEPDNVRAINDSISGELATLTRDLLQKDPDQRPPDAEAVLGRLSTDRPVSAPRRRTWPGPKAIVAAGAALVVLVAAVLLYGRWSSDRKAWAEDVGMPALDSLGAFTDEWTAARSWHAYRTARRVLSAVPEARESYGQFEGWTSLTTIPGGATVEIRDGERGAWEWIRLGTTPLDSVSMPRGYHEARLSLPDYEVTERFMYGGSHADPDTVRLYPLGTSPRHMVRIRNHPRRWSGRDLDVPNLQHVRMPDVAEFFMDRYEVTNARYREFADAGGYLDSTYWRVPIVVDGASVSFEDSRALFVDESGRPGPASWSVGTFPAGEEEYPVRGVSWYEAAAFAAWDGSELPSIFHWVMAFETQRIAFHSPNIHIGSNAGVLPVGASGSMGQEGPYDLAGNVREWVWNEEPDRGYRYLLGGAWDDDRYRAVDGYASPPLERDPGNGFRTIRWIGQPDPVLLAGIDKPFRDYSEERPISDAEFERVLSFYRYDESPLDAVVSLADSLNPDYSTFRVEFDTGYGERTYGFLNLPKRGRPPYEAVFLFPGDAHWSSGEPWDGSLNDRLGAFIARDGRATFRPVFRNTYDRPGELTSAAPNETVTFRDHRIYWSKEVQRSIDYLVSRDDIDPDRIGYYGLSWGASEAPVMLATEPRFRAAVLVVGGLSFERALPEVDAFNFLPRVTIPVLMMNGIYDYYFPFATSQRPFFDNLGTREPYKQLQTFDTPHSGAPPTPVLIRETIAWFDRYLTGIE